MLILTLSGLLHAKTEERGHTEILGKIHPGEWLGEINLFDPSTAVCSVEAVEPSEYWVITREAFEKFINKNHAAGSVLLIGLAMTLSKRIRSLTEKHVLVAKSKKKPMLWAALGVVAIIAAVGIWKWAEGNGLINKLRVEKQQSVAGAYQELEASKVKAKELELEVTRLGEEVEWTKAEAEKKAAQPSTPPTVGLHGLVGQPEAFGWHSRLPEHIDRDAATRIPVAADPQPDWRHVCNEALADAHDAGLMEGGMVAERSEEQL
jgi:hypothetical protein